MSLAAAETNSKLPDLDRVPRVDEVGVNERVARFQSRSIKKESKLQALRMVLSMIDLTTLEGQDTPGRVRQLCQKAMHLHDAVPGLPHPAGGVLALERRQVDHRQHHPERLHLGFLLDGTALEAGDTLVHADLVDARHAVQVGQLAVGLDGSEAHAQDSEIAVSSATLIISSNVVARSSTDSALPDGMSSLTVQMASASAPCSAAIG